MLVVVVVVVALAVAVVSSYVARARVHMVREGALQFMRSLELHYQSLDLDSSRWWFILR